MSTKYILHGGVMSPKSESNKAFYQEMVAGLSDPKILLVYFSRELSEYDYLFNRDRENFKWANSELKPEFYIASIETFEEDVKDADVIMFAGGDTDKLFAAVQESGVDLKQLFKDKVVAGSSAGAYLLSKWYYTNSGKEVRQGLGLLDVAAWAHYRADRGNEYFLEDRRIDEIESELKSKMNGGYIALLAEQEFEVFER